MKDRLPAMLLAAAMLAGVLALFVYSLEARHRSEAEREFFLSFPRAALSAPSPATVPTTVIDARGKPAPTLAPAPSLVPAPPSAPASAGTPPVLAAPPGLSGFSAAPPAPRPAPRKGEDLLTSPYRAKNQAQLDAEMAKKTAPPQLPCTGTTEDGPDGSAVLLNLPCLVRKFSGMEEPQPGASVGITDPFCKLVVFLAGTGGCGPPPTASVTVTDAQVKAAIAAANKRRGGGP